VQSVLQQVDGLKQAIAAHDARRYKSLAKTLVATVSKRFDQRLVEACQQFDQSPDQERQLVISVVGQYAAFVKNDEILQMLDDNPFDVKMTVRPTLAKALADIQRSITRK
jgi:hypothetical protein